MKQGKIADAEIVVHWGLLEYMPEARKWLSSYVMFVRSRALSRVVCHGVSCGDLHERGPPDAWQTELGELLVSQYECTKVACSQVRIKLN